MTSLRQLGRGLAALALAITLAAVTHRGLARLPDFYWENGEGVAHETSEALPVALADPHPLGLVVGASLTARLNPLVLDAVLHEHGLDVTTYNFSLPGSGIDGVAVMAHRLTHELDARHRRATLALLEVPLTWLTRRAQETARSTPFFYVEAHDAQTLQSWVPRFPLVALDVLYRRYILGGSYPSDASNWLRERLIDRDWPCRDSWPDGIPDDEFVRVAAWCRATNDVGANGIGPMWDPATRGFPRIAPGAEKLWEDTTPLTPEQRRDKLERHLRRLVARHGLLELELSDEAIADFVAAADDLRRDADHFAFVIMPESSIVRDRRTPAARDRVNALVRQLTTHGPVIDLRMDMRFVDADFLDAVHAEPLAEHSDKFARAAAEGVARQVLRPK